jgi:phage shock protein A
MVPRLLQSLTRSGNPARSGWGGKLRLAENGDLAVDLELLLQRAQEEMRAVHIKHRERAVQAITQKNCLLQMMDDRRRQIKELHDRASKAESRGQHDRAAQYRDEADRYAETLNPMAAQYREVVEWLDEVKAEVKAEEERIRQETAQAIALQAQWKIAQIEQTISRRLADINAYVQDASHAERRAVHERNHDTLFEALKARFDLEQMVKDTARKVDMLQAKAELAQKRGDVDMECQLLRERESYEAALQVTQNALDRADRMISPVTALWREEEARLTANRPTSTSDASPAEMAGEGVSTEPNQ